MFSELDVSMKYTWYVKYLMLYTLCLLPQGKEMHYRI